MTYNIPILTTIGVAAGVLLGDDLHKPVPDDDQVTFRDTAAELEAEW